MHGCRFASTLFLAGLLAACGPGQQAPATSEKIGTTSATVVDAPATALEAPGDPVEGLRVATRIGCNGCHERNGGGGMFHEEPGQYRLVAANLTEKRHLYDDAGIERLLRQGKTHDGHRPFGMPILMFQHLSDQEIRDITAWLRALDPVSNPGLGKTWISEAVAKALADGSLDIDDDLPDPGNRPPLTRPVEPLALGRHLAMTSCPECHARDLNGFPGDTAPSLIVAKAYSPEHFARLMKTGMTASGKESMPTGLMSQMGRYRFSSMTDEEVRSLKLYLDSR